MIKKFVIAGLIAAAGTFGLAAPAQAASPIPPKNPVCTITIRGGAVTIICRRTIVPAVAYGTITIRNSALFAAQPTNSILVRNGVVTTRTLR
jgi:hypothetical protein